ncbi:hypothetical protein RI367_000010 [Sorochytrium milnesiophthora]
MSSASASIAVDQLAGITQARRGDSDATATVEQTELSTLSGRVPASLGLVESMTPVYSTLVPPAPGVSDTPVDVSTDKATATEIGVPVDQNATQKLVQASHAEATAPPPKAAGSQAPESLAPTEHSATSTTAISTARLLFGLRDPIELDLKEHEWNWSRARETWLMLPYVSSVERRQLVTSSRRS